MNYYKSIIYISLLALTVSVGVTFAQTTTPASSTEETSVEVSLPMDKSEFLLYYGITEKDEINTEIATLRKDFIQKVENLKTEYQKNFEKAVQNQDLKLPNSTQVENVESEKPETTKAEASKRSIEIKPVQSKTATAKVTLTDKKEILMAPIINITNTKATPYTENSSWFQKIKSLFKW